MRLLQSTGLSGVCFRSHRCQIKSFIFTSFLMGWHLGSGGHESTVKTHKNGESNFHLKGGSRPGPTKQSGAFPAERGHRAGSLRHIFVLDDLVRPTGRVLLSNICSHHIDIMESVF